MGPEPSGLIKAERTLAAPDIASSLQNPPITLDRVTRAAIAADKHGLIDLPVANASAHEVYDVAISLASGRIFERLMSSWLVKRHGDPIAVYRVGLERPDATYFQFQFSARWLRFVARSGKGQDVAQLAKDVIKKLTLGGLTHGT
ncbi:hypothetical protein QEV83_09350 [Methylocapsa sp. D3K7]|uniref:hypothetical protein n=1 Tax=Methylocapsa sp. D3K7 TaxID=3041435 RepID=UPI00244EAED0|nr:hypothetical protein [Methylocapsa sp. D3K7]WGJ16414.1 hypothetical protein QEV83_09350 [Methylocapsa sp. D3K7]